MVRDVSLLTYISSVDPKYYPLIAPCISGAAALLGVFVAFVGYYLTHRLTLKRADREYRLKKREELYMAAKSISNATESIMQYFHDATKAWLEQRPSTSNTSSQAKASFQQALEQADILVSLYLPEFNPLLQRISQSFHAMTGAFRDRILDEEHYKVVSNKYDALARNVNALLTAISATSRKDFGLPNVLPTDKVPQLPCPFQKTDQFKVRSLLRRLFRRR